MFDKSISPTNGGDTECKFPAPSLPLLLFSFESLNGGIKTSLTIFSIEVGLSDSNRILPISSIESNEELSLP